MNQKHTLRQQVKKLILDGIHAQEQIASYKETKSFFVADLLKAEEIHRYWATQLPDVTPYYGM